MRDMKEAIVQRPYLAGRTSGRMFHRGFTRLILNPPVPVHALKVAIQAQDLGSRW